MAGLRDPAAALLAAVPTSAAVRRARRLALLVPGRARRSGWRTCRSAQALVPGARLAGRPARRADRDRTRGRRLGARARRPSRRASPHRCSGSPPPGPPAASTTTSSSVLLAWQHHPWIVTARGRGRAADGEEPMTTATTAPAAGGRSPAGGRWGAGPDRGAAGCCATRRRGSAWCCRRGGCNALVRDPWASAHYEGLVGCGLAPAARASRWRACPRSAASTCRCPTTRRWTPTSRSLARLLGGLALVAAGGARRRARAPSGCGCAAGWSSATSRAAPRTRTTPCPSCCSRCCSPCFAVALGAAVVHVVRHAAGGVDRAVLYVVPRRRGVLDVQRAARAVADAAAGPADRTSRRVRATPTRRRFPADWLLSAPGRVPGLLGAARRLARSWRPGTTSTWSP